jgi:hypothetical protein
VFREFRAFLSLDNYPAEPISKQWLDGTPADLNFEKSLDSYAKREHVRVWNYQRGTTGEEVWLVSYTRETSAALSPRYRKFIHHVDANPDSGRDRLVNEFALKGCVESHADIRRESTPHDVINATGDPMHSSGTMPVARLQTCTAPPDDPSVAGSTIPTRPKSKIVRYVRSEILAYRSDVVRSNILFTLFDVTRLGVNALRHKHVSVTATQPEQETALRGSLLGDATSH